MPSVINGVELSARTVSYLETALWSSSVMLPAAEGELIDYCMDVDEDHPLHGINEQDDLDEHFSIEDIDEESLRNAEAVVNAFFDSLVIQDLYRRALEFADDDQIAHDFWLTRNNHGSGFWDGGYGDRSNPANCLGNELTTLCDSYREVYLFIDNDGKLHFEGY